MGLDSYLYKRTYVKNWDHMRPEEKHEISIVRGGQPTTIKPERISYIVEQVAYWRKANQVHKWFVDNVQGGKDECQESNVDFDQLSELLGIVDKILATPELAKELLPTEAGFFFGNTEYGDDYMADMRNTKAQLATLLAEPKADVADYYYYASW